MKSRGTWVTKAGEELEIAWMNTRHLTNTANMLLRAGAQDGPVFEECRLRGLRPQDGRFRVPHHSETRKGLCLMNALIEHGIPYDLERRVTDEWVRAFPPKVLSTFIKLQLQS